MPRKIEIIFPEGSMPIKQQGNRIYFIDYARGFIVVLVVVLHAAAPYLSFVPYKWIVVDTAASPLCDYVVLASEFFVMAVLFSLPVILLRRLL
jgi:uncharacterized membrane protein YcfT